MPGSETLSPFFNADIRTSLFSADVLEKCACVALHLIAEEGRGGEDGCHAPGLGDEWKMGCPQSSICGGVKAKLGRKTNVCLPVALEKAMCATMRCTSLGWAWWQDLSFLAGLAAGKGGFELPHGPGVQPRGLLSRRKSFSHRGRAVTAEERVVTREKRRDVSDEPF